MRKKLLILAGIMAVMSGSAYASVATSFDVDLSPDAQNFVVNAATALTLTYAIDGSGNIALNAAAPGGGAARWNQIDNGSAGTTSSSALFGTTLILTYSGTAAPILTWPVNYGNAGSGSVLSTQGQGNANALENGESITFTVSGSATLVSGFSLNLVDFSYDNRLANGGSSFGVEDTDGNVVEQKISNTSLFGTIDGTGISLGAGEAMTFRTIAGNDGGAGLNGFTFDVVAIPEPATLGLVAVFGGGVLFIRRLFMM
jgi:hypothetical protein